MENKMPAIEIKGNIAVQMANQQTLEDLCMEFIPGYNRDRFEALAIRLFIGEETIITIYALDKIRQEDSLTDKTKIPVKKFKITNIDISTLFSYCHSFNCTLSTNNYPLEDMEVVNK